LEKAPVEGLPARRDEGIVTVNDQLIEELVTVQVDGAPADLPSKNRDAPLLAGIQIYFLCGVLEVSNADIGRARRQEDQSLSLQPGQSMVQEL
jgi:hypothetical protein